MSIQKTVSTYPTYFLSGVDLVTNARNEYKICSENWTYPTQHRLGTPKDAFYGEVWSDGMDWDLTFWLLYQDRGYELHCIPLMHFDRNEEADKFNDCDFAKLMDCLLYHFGYQDQNSDAWRYRDEVISWLKKVGDSRNPAFIKYSFGHGSQELVEFDVNKEIMEMMNCRKLMT